MYGCVYLAKGTMNSPRMFPFGPYDIYNKSETGSTVNPTWDQHVYYYYHHKWDVWTKKQTLETEKDNNDAFSFEQTLNHIGPYIYLKYGGLYII